MKKVLKSFLFLIMVSLSVTLVHAQQPGSLDMTFNAHDTILYNYLQRANENITATTVQSDGKIIFAGITKPSLFYPKLVRLNADGSNDNSFVPPAFQANNAIKKIIVLGTGKILVVTSQSSATPWSSSLIGLNSDGSIDSDFNIGSTVGTIFDLMLLPDGKILAIGSFQTYNSIAMKYMVKLNLDGSLDSSFPSQNISNSSFSYCTFQSDGKILVASGSMILRFDQNGTYDPSFIISVSGAISIIGITVQQDDKLLLTTYNNISQITNVDRYIADATLDVLFTKPTIGKTAYLLTSSFVNGKILLVGDFKTINSVTKSGVVLLSNDGQIDPLFQSILPATTVAKSTTINTDGSFLLSTNKGIMKFNSLGAFINVYVPLISVDGLISSSIMQLDGKLIIGGDFSAYNGQACIDIVRLNLDGSIDPSFTSPFDSPYCSISFLVLQFDGKILVGGSLFNGKSLVRLNSDGTIDPTFITTYEPPMLFNTCTLQSDGKLVLSSGYAPHIFRLNSDGSTDNSFQAKSNSLTSGNIVAIAVQSDKKIIIGGFFSLYDGRKTGFARLNEDGSVDETFRVGNNPIPNQGVWALSIQPDGRILVAGSFNVFNGTTTGSLTRLNRDGSIDLTFAVGKVWSSVKSVKYQPDGKILIGGDFTSYAGVARYKIARLNFDGSLDLSFIPEQLMWNRFYLVEHLNIHPTGIYAVGINTLNKGIVVRMNSEPIINNCFYTNILYKDVKDITCTGIKGYATVEAISDFPPFQYAWGNSTDPTNPYQEFTSAGIHGVTITDAKGCIRSSSLLITAPKYINAYDVTANLRPTTFRPGVASNISISLYNEGCIPAYGKLKLLLSCWRIFNSFGSIRNESVFSKQRLT